MRRVLAPVLPLLAALIVTAPASAIAPVTPNVVGGAVASLGDAPWQALVLPDGYLCGGSILDATHVVTAAHCVYDENTKVIDAPGDVEVYAGITDIGDRGTFGQTATVASVVVDPAYDPDHFTSDAAILTLAAPGFDLSGPSVKAIALPAVNWQPAAQDLLLSGWGTTLPRFPDDSENTDETPDLLQKAALRTSQECVHYGDFDPDLHLCAGQTGKGACQGDSGGPLAAQVGGAWQLAGIVSASAGCAWEGYPALYTRTADAGINAFLAARGVGYAVDAPVATSSPTLGGTAAIARRLTCANGAWTGAHRFSYRFVSSSGTVVSTTSEFVADVSHLGLRVKCVVTASGLTGAREAESAPVVIGLTPAEPGAPASPLVPPPPSPSAPPRDTAAPTAKLAKVRCARTVCLLDITVVDPAPSSGVRGVETSVKTAYASRCGKGRKKRRCTKTVVHRLTAIPTSTTSFRVTTPRLRKGTQTFTLVATDQAGNRQRLATALKKKTG